jgi:D-hydroxyproline dehydrogenase subunit beta
VLVVDRGGIGAGASGRNGGFLFRHPEPWINELFDESVRIYADLQEHGGVPLDLRRWPMLIVAVDEADLPAARAYSDAVGGEEIDLGGGRWFADDLAGAFVVDDGYTLDPMGATSAVAEAARSAGVEFAVGCEAKRILLSNGRVHGLVTDEGIVSCARIVLAAGPQLRPLVRTAGADLPLTTSRGWLLETDVVDPPPRYAVGEATWPLQEEMGTRYGFPTLGRLAADTEDPTFVSLLLGGRPAGHVLLGTSLHRSLRDEAETPETMQEVAARAVRIAPVLRDVPVVASWSGRRAHTPDGLPIAGPVGGVEGLDVLGGLSSIGMITGPALARRYVAGAADLFAPARLA